MLHNKKINDYLEEMAKTTYDYWFVQLWIFQMKTENHINLLMGK